MRTNCLDLIPYFVRQSDGMRNAFDEKKRRRSVGSVELDVFNPAKAVGKSLPRLDVFHAIQLERVGHFAKNAFYGFQSFAR